MGAWLARSGSCPKTVTRYEGPATSATEIALFVADLTRFSIIDEMDLLGTYELIRSGLEGCELPEPLEPFEHVNEVERLRIAFRPENVRLLLFAESHVRISDVSFADKGAGFIYNHRYFTPWWNDLLLPALSTQEVQNAGLTEQVRLAQLSIFQRLGFWVLDASIIALSGYKKLGKHFEGRPFDVVKGAIIENSWEYVGPIVDEMLNQAQPPVICYFQTVDFVLPEVVKRKGIALKFRTQANTSVYRSETYWYGTVAFISAARRAGIVP